jgi:hypothetical protein
MPDGLAGFVPQRRPVGDIDLDPRHDLTGVRDKPPPRRHCIAEEPPGLRFNEMLSFLLRR